MIPAGLKAGSAGLRWLTRLYKGRKSIRKGANVSSKWLASKNMGGAAKVAEATGKKITYGSRWAGKKIRKYPKSAAALGGAVGWDIIDND